MGLSSNAVNLNPTVADDHSLFISETGNIVMRLRNKQGWVIVCEGQKYSPPMKPGYVIPTYELPAYLWKPFYGSVTLTQD